MHSVLTCTKNQDSKTAQTGSMFGPTPRPKMLKHEPKNNKTYKPRFYTVTGIGVEDWENEKLKWELGTRARTHAKTHIMVT